MRMENEESANDDANNVTPMTATEAQAWRARQPKWSVWRVLAWQLVVSLVLSVFAWFVGGLTTMLSVSWGGVCVLLPSALFARVLSASVSVPAGGFLFRLLLWEGVKVLLTVALLFASPHVLPGVNWLAMVMGFVVTMKISWFAAFYSMRTKR